MDDGSWTYANSLIAAAREVARTPFTIYDPIRMDQICRNYGLFLDQMTDDEYEEFELLVEEYKQI